ncbi:MAG: hypothetical protein QM638_01125 [Nocardioides sp.]|uniref:hypothetical protein n=1 Tax=Nocardioides sp. TaxID=35761 RepID=UPI0039E656D0
MTAPESEVAALIEEWGAGASISARELARAYEADREAGALDPQEVATLRARAENVKRLLEREEQWETSRNLWRARAEKAERERDELSRLVMSTENGAAVLQMYVGKAQDAEAEKAAAVAAERERVLGEIERLSERAAVDLWWTACDDGWPVPDDLPAKFLRTVIRALRGALDQADLRENGGES